ncbi:unnamed protein product, partial [Anisakis simplex]|uniref:BPI1 domain-containing protein n=1 Tax=Anisakis simplex TaxID=6269 RepID=A0A0M3KCE0_ANISI
MLVQVRVMVARVCLRIIRFLPSAIQYLNQIASQIIAQQLPRIRIPNVVHRLANDQEKEVKEVPYFFRFLGDLSGELRILLPLALEGQAEVQAQGVDFRLESALERWTNGSAHLRTISCQTTIKALDVENYNGGLTGVALNIFKTATSNLIRPIIQAEVCRKVRKFIDETLNEKLAETQTKSSFARRNYEKSSRSYMDESDDEFQVVNNLEENSHISNYLFSEQLAKQTFIDFRLTEDPVCYTNTIELANLGNVSIGNETSETPFGIPSLRWPSLANRNDSMVDLIISDYVPNALLYHAYKKTTESDMTHKSIVLNVIETNLLKRQRFGGCCSERLLNFKIDESNSPSMSSFLRTKCSSGSVCLADMLPQLTDRYPNNKLELLIAAINPPSIVFSSDNDGSTIFSRPYQCPIN